MHHKEAPRVVCSGAGRRTSYNAGGSVSRHGPARQLCRSRLTLAEAKERLRIPDLWARLNLPGKPSKHCRCPWREDRKPSFSVSADGKLWHDFATGEAGDAIAFFARATGLSAKTACRKFLELAGGGFGVPRLATPAPATPAPPRERPKLPTFHRSGPVDVERLASLRQLRVEGVALVRRRGLLWFANWRGFPAWIISDGERVNAQARRMDGECWQHHETKPKSDTLPGCWASWPVGVGEAKPFKIVAIVEGGPDLLAAHHFIYCETREADVAAVAILGASNRIHADTLRLFAGKRVRLFPHVDGAGRDAAERWARQLESVGADVDAFDFAGLCKTDGLPVKDLNDLAAVHADDFEAERTLWRILP